MFGRTPMSRAEKLLIELEQKIAELNGDPDAIRNAVQEYLESHPEAFNVIDDSLASGNTTYSSSKIMDLFSNIDIPVPSQPYEIVPLGNHSYDYHTDILDYGFAKKYMKENGVVIGGGCSSVRKGSIYGRKFDWFYDNHVEFRVFTEANTFRHGVVGTAAVLDITENDVSSTEYNELLRIVPFALVDGVNDAGVFMNVNVVPQDYGTTTLVEATTLSKEEISAAMLVRFVLDRFGDATTAANYLKHYVDIYMPEKMNEMGYELHWMLGDKTSTYCLEFIEGSLEILDISANPYMTNFHLYNVTLDANGKVTINHDGEPNESGVTELGSGLERFNIIADAYSGLEDSTDWEALMSDLDYTNAYNEDTDPFWYTEFVGYNGLTCSSPVADYASVVSTAIDRFVNRDRDAANTWITCHSLLADLDSLEMNYIFQEDYTNDHTAFVPTKPSGGTLDQDEVEIIISGYLEDHPELFAVLDDSASYSQTKGWTSKKIVDKISESLSTAFADLSSELAESFASITHAHDDRYYTETEVNALISGVNASFDDYYTKTESNTLFNERALNISIGEQGGDDRIFVIGLCEFGETPTQEVNNVVFGSVYLDRHSGIIQPFYLNFEARAHYGADFAYLNIIASNLQHDTTMTKTSQKENVFRTCTFEYNGHKYFGILCYHNQKLINNFFVGGSNNSFRPFLVDVCNGSYGTVYNQEIYDSIVYDASWVHHASEDFVTITSTDPGEGSALESGKIIIVVD